MCFSKMKLGLKTNPKGINAVWRAVVPNKRWCFIVITSWCKGSHHANFSFQDKRLKSICWVHAIRLLFFFIHVYPKLVPLHTILRSGWILVLRGTEPEGWNKWSCIWSFSWSSPKPYNRLMRDSLFFLWPVTPFYGHDNSKRSHKMY